MKFLSFLLTLFLVWTAAAAVIQDREPKGATAKTTTGKTTTGKTTTDKTTTDKTTTDKTTTDKTTAAAKGKPNKHQALLIQAAQKGAPKYTFPNPPAKGKKVSKRSAGADDATRTVQRRADNPKLEKGEADINKVETGTSADEVSTKGLATCVGVIVTFGKVSPGKVDKIVAHIGAFGGQPAITAMGKAIMDAAVEGGVWDPDVDEGHRPQIHVLWPDVDGEVKDMVDSDADGDVDARSLTATLNGVVSDVGKELQKMSTLLRGTIFEKTRTRATATGAAMKATANGAVTADGQAF